MMSKWHYRLRMKGYQTAPPRSGSTLYRGGARSRPHLVLLGADLHLQLRPLVVDLRPPDRVRVRPVACKQTRCATRRQTRRVTKHVAEYDGATLVTGNTTGDDSYDRRRSKGATSPSGIVATNALPKL